MLLINTKIIQARWGRTHSSSNANSMVPTTPNSGEKELTQAARVTMVRAMILSHTRIAIAAKADPTWALRQVQAKIVLDTANPILRLSRASPLNTTSVPTRKTKEKEYVLSQTNHNKKLWLGSRTNLSSGMVQVQQWTTGKRKTCKMTQTLL